ncbi:mitochondrial ribonuclease P catalytic subunit-like isoform X1 [Hylaeus anthracinus]|uniref:mitochondrial ribonuclease P catalytic subunit-like isoform X1 n=2 Tax=Hylaeus anthracinus TaxID=313031 RepID=UPI0023B89F24|nr:mitochondrial ribonuclease P catalytic subunit-like isoform X1 [Hylaeus anthracinus]
MNMYVRRVQFFCTYTAKLPISVTGSTNSNLQKKKIRLHNLIWTRIEMYKEALVNPHLPKETWQEIRKNIMDSRLVKPMAVDSLIMELCYNEQFADAGISYYKLLEQNNSQFSVITACKYLLLYKVKQSPITDVDKRHILNVYKTVVKQYPVLDFFVATSCIVTLCKIDEWEKSIEIIKCYEMHDSKFLKEGYSVLIDYLLNHCNMELAQKYLICSFKKDVGPLNYVYNSYLKLCLKDKQTFNENIEKLFKLWMQYDIKPDVGTVKEFIQICNKVGWSAKITTLIFTKCSACQQRVLIPPLSEEEFKRLSETVLQKLFVEKGYKSTVPEEIVEFIEFVKETKPYDIIIDGLNVLHKQHSPKNYKVLDALLTHFNAQNQKVLVIGRNYLTKFKWIKNLQTKATFFFVDDSSKDDPFVLYATLLNGNNAKFISQDLMRQHKFDLEDGESRALFKRWQFTHQYTFTAHLSPFNLSSNTIDLTLMQNYVTTNTNYIHSSVHKQNNCWHIPFQLNAIAIQRVNYVHSNHWACFNMCE